MIPKLAKPVVLTGFWASGKTVVGKRLSERMAVPYVDLLPFVEKQAGVTIHQLVSHQGLTRFRDLESKALGLQLILPPYGVISTGGGTFIREANIQIARSRAHLIHLDIDLDLAWKRLQKLPSTNRIFFSDQFQESQDLNRCYEARQAGYDSCHWRIPVDDLPVSEVVDRIIDHLVAENMFVWDDTSLGMAN